MKFESHSPWIVRSIKQRDLLNTWLRARTKRNGVPHLKDCEPGRFDEEKPDLAYLTIASESPPRVVIDTAGTRITSAFGKSAEGKFLDEYVDANLISTTMPLYYECINRQLPVYTVSSVTDVHQIIVAHERLILPFAETNRVDSLIVSMKPISEEGGFEIKDLMRADSRVPIFQICAVIDKDLFHTVSRKNVSGDEIESS